MWYYYFTGWWTTTPLQVVVRIVADPVAVRLGCQRRKAIYWYDPTPDDGCVWRCNVCVWCPDGKARGNTLTASSAVRRCFYRPPRPAVFGNKTKRNNQAAVLLVKIPHAFAPAPLPHARRLCECVCVIVCISSGDNNIIIKTHCHRRTFYHGGRATIHTFYRIRI